MLCKWKEQERTRRDKNCERCETNRGSGSSFSASYELEKGTNERLIGGGIFVGFMTLRSFSSTSVCLVEWVIKNRKGRLPYHPHPSPLTPEPALEQILSLHPPPTSSVSSLSSLPSKKGEDPSILVTTALRHSRLLIKSSVFKNKIAVLFSKLCTLS